jgi:colicin import membrane protein
MAGSVPHEAPQKENRFLPILLAVLVHVGLFTFFWVGIRLQNEVPLAVEAEIWDVQYKEAAPLPEPEPEPEIAPEPEPEPVVVPPKPVEAPPPPKVETPVAENPEIALEKEKKRLDELKKKEAEQKKEELRKEALRKEEIRKEALRKEEEKKELLKKQEEEKLAKAKAEEKKKEAEEKKKAEAEKQKKAAETKAAELKKAADAKAAEQRRKSELQRMMSQAGGSGTAEKTQGPRGASNYASKIAVKIRSNTLFEVPATLSSNPAVEYTVDLLPDGSVRNVRKTKSSGVPGFDEAVARAIDKSQPFPPDTDGKVPNSINVIHRPKEQ